MEKRHEALAAARSACSALKLRLFLFSASTHPLCPRALRYYTYQKAISDIYPLQTVVLCAISLVGGPESEKIKLGAAEVKPARVKYKQAFLLLW